MVGFWTPNIPEPQLFNHIIIWSAAIYAVMVMACTANDGLLAFWDDGPRPARPRPKPTKPLIAKIGKQTNQSMESLTAIFSRRDPGLHKITGKEEG